MTRLANSFEGGTNGVTITTGNSGGASGDAFQDIQLGSGTIVYDSANAAHGGMAATFNPVTAVCYVAYTTSLGTLGEVYGRCYVKLASLPPVTLFLVRFGAASSVNRGFISIKTDGTVGVVDSLLVQQAVSTNALTAGSYARLEWHFIGDPTVGHLAARIFLTPDSTSVTETVTASNINTGGTAINYRVGMTGTGLSDMSAFSVDDLVWDTADYPGPAVLSPFLPLIGQSPTLYAPKMNRSFSIGFINQNPTLYTPKMRKFLTAMVRIDQAPTVYAPTKTKRQVTSGGAFQEGAFQANAFQTGDGKLFVDGSPALYNPSITQQVVLPGLGVSGAFQADAFQNDAFQVGTPGDGINQAPVLYAPEVQFAAGNVFISFLQQAPQVFAPGFSVATPGLPQEVRLDFGEGWDSDNVFWDGDTSWDASGTGGFINQAGSVLAAAVHLSLTVGFIDNAPTVFEPSLGIIQRVDLAFIDRAGFTFNPQRFSGTVVIPFLDNAGVAFTPVISYANEVDLDFIDQEPVLYEFQLNTQMLSFSLINNAGFTFTPQKVTETIGVGLIDRSPVLYAPVVNAFVIPLIDNSGIVFALGEVVFNPPDITVALIDQAGEVFELYRANVPFQQTIRLDETAEQFIDNAGDIFDLASVFRALPQTIHFVTIDQHPQVFAPRIPRALRNVVHLRARYEPVIRNKARYDPVIRNRAMVSQQG